MIQILTLSGKYRMTLWTNPELLNISLTLVIHSGFLNISTRIMSFSPSGGMTVGVRVSFTSNQFSSFIFIIHYFYLSHLFYHSVESRMAKRYLFPKDRKRNHFVHTVHTNVVRKGISRFDLKKESIFKT